LIYSGALAGVRRADPRDVFQFFSHLSLGIGITIFCNVEYPYPSTLFYFGSRGKSINVRNVYHAVQSRFFSFLFPFARPEYIIVVGFVRDDQYNPLSLTNYRTSIKSRAGTILTCPKPAKPERRKMVTITERPSNTTMQGTLLFIHTKGRRT